MTKQGKKGFKKNWGKKANICHSKIKKFDKVEVMTPWLVMTCENLLIMKEGSVY